MPARLVKMNMIVGNARSNNAVHSKSSVPMAKSMSQLYAPMVSRIAGVKSGCACGK